MEVKSDGELLSPDLGSQVVVEKSWCSACSFYVKSEGHEQRCGVRNATPMWLKELAWIGDAMLALQVRASVLAVAGQRDGKMVESYTSGEALSEFACHYPPVEVLPELVQVGTSKHSIADAVEAAIAIDPDYLDRFLRHFSLPVVAVSTKHLEQHVEAVIIRTGLRNLAVRLPGYCYLLLCRTEVWQVAMRNLGAYPTVADLRRCSYLRMAVNVAVRSAKCGYHLVEDSQLPLRLVPDVLECMLMTARVGGDYQVAVEEQLPLLPCPELRGLVTRDFSTCQCQLHRAFPLVQFDTGCCTIRSAEKGPIAAAQFEHGTDSVAACTAEDSVRKNDKKLLRLLVKDDDPGVLYGGTRSGRVRRLCTGRLSSFEQYFGRGFCYLKLLPHDSWWRIARLLGPSPRVTSVLRAMLWLGCDASMHCSIEVVRDGMYHVRDDAAGAMRACVMYRWLAERAIEFEDSRFA